MNKDNATSPDRAQTPAQRPEVDYTPKTHSTKKQLLFGIKMGVGTALFFLVIWLYETHLLH